ncbi:MAG TPA: DUF1365 domain-containing protein [Solirubrobacterales bacterium]|nr:DUF1365 domain-containing protein [Solirubrobacterales bacterium]
MSESAVYEGWIRHRRFAPVEHSFRYRTFLMYLDLAELPAVLDPFPLYSARRRAPVRLRRGDCLGDPARPLDECVRDAVAAAGAPRPAGPVRLLTGLRHLGHGFNPVSFYYCFDPTGRRVAAIVAEVENIPWGERHAYVLERGEREGTVLAAEIEKNHHVSPLMGMAQTYSFRAGTPGERLQIHIESRPRGAAATDGPGAGPTAGGTTLVAAPAAPKTFDATLSLRRRELSRPLMLGLLARYPANSLRTVARIYAQAARLRLKGARYHPHPEGAEVAR